MPSGLSEEALLSLDSMEGLYQPPVVNKKGAKPKPALSRAAAGYLTIAAVVAAAYALHYLPFAPFRVASEHGFRRPVSASILAILLGVAARAAGFVPGAALEKSKQLVKRLMPALIVLTGAGLDLAQMWAIGPKALVVIVLCIVVSFTASVYFGRVFGAWRKTSILIGAGTAICGTSAIVAAAPVIDAEDEEITLAVGAVNVLGLLLMFCFPIAGSLMHLAEDVFGVWAGTSIHAVPQVVAAGFAFSEKAGLLATLVKLVRVTLLAPFLVALVFLYGRRAGTTGYEWRLSRMVPPFLWGFLALAALSTVQLIPVLEFRLADWAPAAVRSFRLPLSEALVEAGGILLTIVMAAMGLEVNLKTMANVGRPALLTGLAAAAVLAIVSLVLVRVVL